MSGPYLAASHIPKEVPAGSASLPLSSLGCGGCSPPLAAITDAGPCLPCSTALAWLVGAGGMSGMSQSCELAQQGGSGPPGSGTHPLRGRQAGGVGEVLSRSPRVEGLRLIFPDKETIF